MAKTTQASKLPAHRPDLQATNGHMVAVANYDTDSFRVIGVYTFQASAEEVFFSLPIADCEGKFIIPVIAAN